MVSAWATFTNWEYRWLWALLVIPALAFDHMKWPYKVAGAIAIVIVSVAPWVTRTDVTRDWRTSLLSLLAVSVLSAVTAAGIVALLRQRSEKA